MDCGGEDCPPCEHAPDQRSFTTPTDNLPTIARAIQKITAGNAAVRVLPGQDVSFHTLGTIELLPGFEVQAGGNFNAVIKNSIYSVTAPCDKFCHPIIYTLYHRYCTWPWPHTNNTFCADVTLASKIKLTIWAPTTITNNWKKIYTTTVENQVGLVPLWDLIEGDFDYNLKKDNKWRYYKYVLDFYPCQGGKLSYYGDFVIVNGKDDHDKNSNKLEYEEYEETEASAPFVSPPLNNITLQDENTAPNFVIIPNPNPGAFQLETNFPLSDIVNLKISNLLGVPVYETQNLTSHIIQLSNSATGYHFVMITLKDGTVLTQKMMLQR
jgi:hypothetical protein